MSCGVGESQPIRRLTPDEYSAALPAGAAAFDFGAWLYATEGAAQAAATRNREGHGNVVTVLEWPGGWVELVDFRPAAAAMSRSGGVI